VTTTPGYVEDKEAILKRLRGIEGQARGLQRMVEDERYCIDVVTRVAAAPTALERVALEVVGNPVRHCVASGEASVEQLMGAVERLVRTR
jgi:CsoR family transcriptional regulator, copper-sensing transcriptional repressor